MKTKKSGTAVKESKTKTDDYKSFNLHGAEYRTLYTSKFENRKNWEKPDEKKVVSFIPGTINTLRVKEGDTVVKGQEILVLEAMKMLNSVKAPIDGIVEKINVKLGDRIPKNHLIVEFAVLN